MTNMYKNFPANLAGLIIVFRSKERVLVSLQWASALRGMESPTLHQHQNVSYIVV